jgi:hypothetical protein
VSAGNLGPARVPNCAPLPAPPWQGLSVATAKYPGLDAAIVAAKATIPRDQQAGSSWFSSSGGQTFLNVGVVSPTPEQLSSFAAAAAQDHTSIAIRAVTVPVAGPTVAARQSLVTRALVAAKIPLSADSRPDVGVVIVIVRGPDVPAAESAVRTIAPPCSVRVLSGDPVMRLRT